MDLIQQIEKIKQSNNLILVEGKKDKRALENLGIENNILTINQPLYKIVEKIAEKSSRCILLTDLDSEGKRLYSKLRRDLQKYGVKINNEFRNFLFKETKLRQIEGLKASTKNII